MRILHYSLGFPPYRSGGLTKFCMDLMKQQIKDGHEVALLWPGQIGFLLKGLKINNRGKDKISGIQSYEVINPLPIPFDEGIKDFEKFTNVGDIKTYRKFLEDINPEVIHVHTLMGLHKAFLDAVKEKQIRLVFTAHDFFPICPKVTMFRHSQICASVSSCSECGVCNVTALSLKKIQILQSSVYRLLKDSIIVKKLRKQHRDKYLSEETADERVQPVGNANDFKQLRAFYESMLRLMNVIHYNSSVTKEVYEQNFGELPNKIIAISHDNITDHRKLKKFNNDKLRIRYLGPYGRAKGFFYLKGALDKLWNDRQDFCLDVQFISPERSPYIKSHGRYNYSDLEDIFAKTDVLIAPSIWYETFGYTVLEALSFGVPVIITKNVGAKDILAKGAGIVIEDVKGDQLYEVLKNLNVESLQFMNKVILEKQKILTIKDMANMIETYCYQ